MSSSTRYTVRYRRKREGRTDYKSRKALLSSHKPRVVIRRSLKHIWLQIADYGTSGDKVHVMAHSRELAKYGWKASTSGIPAAYLTGMLLAKKAAAKGLKEAIADIGLQISVRGSVLYAAVKGVQDGGVSVPCDAAIQPDAKRINGEHVAAYAEQLKKADPKKYAAQFSLMIKNGIAPEALPKHFTDVKKKIEAFK